MLCAYSARFPYVRARPSFYVRVFTIIAGIIRFVRPRPKRVKARVSIVCVWVSGLRMRRGRCLFVK